MSLLQLWHGGGTRRKRRATRAELVEQLTDANKEASKVKDAVLNRCAARIHGDFWVHTGQPQPCPWCEIARLRERIQMLVTRPVLRPDAVAVDPSTGMLRPAIEPAADVAAETQPIQQVALDETQQMSVAEVRNATGEGDTVTLPAVTPVTPPVALDDTQMLVTWGTKLPDAGLTEVPVGLGAKASVNVTAALEEAS